MIIPLTNDNAANTKLILNICTVFALQSNENRIVDSAILNVINGINTVTTVTIKSTIPYSAVVNAFV